MLVVDVYDIDVIELTPLHPSPIHIGYTIGREIGYLYADVVAYTLEYLSIEVENVRHTPRTTYIYIIYINSGRFTHVTEVNGASAVSSATW